MAQVTIDINGLRYGIACDDGQEGRVQALAKYINGRLKEIAGAGAASTEAHLLVLTALVLADELFEVREQLAMFPEDGAPVPAGLSEEDTAQITRAVDHLRQRIEKLARDMKQVA
ncbi:MAG: cell division protein ZapA [Pseudobdellovibrionaceae bacterium]